jgi:squalene synthase HpnC
VASSKKLQNKPKSATCFKHHWTTVSGQSGTSPPRSVESGLPGLKSLKGKRLRDMSFEDDLRRFGPDRSAAVSRAEALAYCARLTSDHYENFSVVSWLTPREHRPAFQSIYAFCRWSDDLGDEVHDPGRSLELFDWWQAELRAMFHGEARHPVMVALRETVRRYQIPMEPFEALIDAFRQDQTITEYDSYDQLLDYCTRSANPVGHLVLHVAGAYNNDNAVLSDATCTALQLANFWQDVARDLAMGRIYLPRQDRQRFGYSEAELRALQFTDAFADLMGLEVERTRGLFEKGRALVPRIPGALAIDVDLFTRGGLAILDRIEALNYDVLTTRPSLGKWTKVWLLGRAVLGLAGARLGGGLGRTKSRPRPAPSDRARSSDVARARLESHR